jgi:TonB family protein
MSAAMMVSFRMPELPWAGSHEDDLRFKRILRNVLILCVLLSLLALLLPVAKPDRTKTEIPPQLATMILENVKPLPPPPKPRQEEAVKRDASDLEAAHKEPEVKKELRVPEARVPQPNKPPGEIAAARRKAAGVGLLAMSNDLAEIRGAPMAVQLNPVKPGAGVGSGVGVGVGAGTDPGVPARALITSNAAGGSGGINTAGYSNNTGGGGLAGRATTVVEGAAGGGGKMAGGYPRGHGAGNGPGGNLQRGSSGKMSRSIEEIKLVFERNKGAIYSIYNRALREDPGLQGKVVVELKISPAGNVIDCRIISSELKSPELEKKLRARILQFDFGSKNVDQMVVTWPLDFLPS